MFLSWAFYRLLWNREILLAPPLAGGICSWGKPVLGHDLQHCYHQRPKLRVWVAVDWDELGYGGVTVCIYHLFLSTEGDGSMFSYT